MIVSCAGGGLVFLTAGGNAREKPCKAVLLCGCKVENVQTFSSSLLGLPLAGTSNVDGDAPAISDVLAGSTELPPLASRMP